MSEAQRQFSRTLGSDKQGRERAGRWPQILRLGVALALTAATMASAQTYKVIKSFSGSDGAFPAGGLVLSGSTLYGATSQGGSAGYGVVFRVNTDGSGYTVLNNVMGFGGDLKAGVVLAGSTLYGTRFGGVDLSCGEIFGVNTDGSGCTVLKSFTGSDGMGPSADLVLSGSTLYGTTQLGGIGWSASGSFWGYGVVFKMSTDGSGYTVLKSFSGSDGMYPEADLVLAGDTLYGMTDYGGSSYSGADYSGSGVVFKMNTDGSGYTVLQGLGSGGSNRGLVLGGNTLYGTTQYGGNANGLVFKVNTDGSGCATLWSFGGSDGQYPTAGLALAGSRLYGTTEYGGRWFSGGVSGNGVVFMVNTDGSGYTVLKDFFTGSDGKNPAGGLVVAGTTLYGTTTGGGPAGDGVVFSLTLCPVIEVAPQSQTVPSGVAVDLSASVSGALAYQWFFNATNALDGATNSLLDLPSVRPSQSGNYMLVVTNIYGAATSPSGYPDGHQYASVHRDAASRPTRRHRRPG